VIKRPENLLFEPLYLNFNKKVFLGLEIDLDHVNKGKRSNLTIRDVTRIVLTELQFKILEPSGSRSFEPDNCDYFEIIFFLGPKKMKMVFCICSDRPRTIGVITLYQVRYQYESL